VVCPVVILAFTLVALGASQRSSALTRGWSWGISLLYFPPSHMPFMSSLSSDSSLMTSKSKCPCFSVRTNLTPTYPPPPRRKGFVGLCNLVVIPPLLLLADRTGLEKFQMPPSHVIAFLTINVSILNFKKASPPPSGIFSPLTLRGFGWNCCFGLAVGVCGFVHNPSHRDHNNVANGAVKHRSGLYIQGEGGPHCPLHLRHSPCLRFVRPHQHRARSRGCVPSET
jgi:hypothetical protein